MPAVRRIRRYLDLSQPSETFVILVSVACTKTDELFLLRKLMYPDRRLKIAQIVFETTINDFVIPVSLLGITVPGILADAVQAEDLHPVVELTIMSHDHTTLSRREVFGCVKAETSGVA